jgi:electron transfer flavoprotein beta subunit
MKWVPLRVEVDPLTGAVAADPRSSGASGADLAALEWGLRLAEAWGGEVLVASAGPTEADGLLREALAAGAARAVRCELPAGAPGVLPAGAPSELVAAALAAAFAGVAVVVCGDWSLDRGSGSVPAFLAARLGAAQALGLVALWPEAPGVVRAERRLDLGRREVLRVRAPAVLSVEGATAHLRRASLPAMLRARDAAVEHLPAPVPDPVAAGIPEPPGPIRRGPYRPRPRVLPGPDPGASARERILALTGAETGRTPPQTVRLDPGPAADRVLAQLRTWGYLE